MDKYEFNPVMCWALNPDLDCPANRFADMQVSRIELVDEEGTYGDFVEAVLIPRAQWEDLQQEIAQLKATRFSGLKRNEVTE